MRNLMCGASRTALGACIGLAAAAAVVSPAFAQDEDTTTVSKVTIVGSLIQGETETGVSNVNVFDAEDLADQGAPNVVEFTRSLPQASQAWGEAEIDTASVASGYSNVNLRGLGGERTLTLFNGHRTDEDTSFIPMAAIGRVEVLNDGAGVTYGAGAVAGVIDFRTRTNFHGAEFSVSDKLFKGSTGEQDYSALLGFGDEHANILLAASYSEQHTLNFTDRPYGRLPFEVNPIQYVNLAANPGEFLVPGGPYGGYPVHDYDANECTAIGGVEPNGTTTCYFYYTPFFNLIDYQSNLRLYASGDFDVTDTMHARFDFGYSRTDVPKVWAAPYLPVIPSHRGAAGTFAYCGFSGYYCQFQVPIVNAGVRNPYVDQYFTRAGINPALYPAGNLYTGLFWEPFGYGGVPGFEDTGNTRYESRKSERYYASGELKGVFSEDGVFSALNGISYDYTVSGGMTRTVNNRRDWIVSRLQDALRGYGGADCAAVDDTPTDYTSNATYDATAGIQDASIAPGTNGCEWFNPFASAFEYSAVNGASNPAYGGSGYENSPELVRWMLGERPHETRNFDINIDALFTGTLPVLSLPGGDIGWAAGAQYRATSFRNQSLAEGDADSAYETQQCPFPEPGLDADYTIIDQAPGQRGCSDTSIPGAYAGTGYYSPSSGNQQIKSLYGELRLPIFDSVEGQLAIRREYYAVLSANTYKAALKWQINDEWAVRGSYSTNYAPPPASINITDPRAGTAYISRFTTFFPTLTTNIPGIKPEQADVMNFGVIYQTDRFGEGSFFNATLDYFDFNIKGQVTTTSVTTVLANVVPVGNSLSSLVDCSAGLISFVSFDSTCVTGTTNAGNITQILAYQTNGPGEEAAGYDLGLNYFKGWGPGDFSAGANFTFNTKYTVTGYSVNGIVFDTGGDRLGYSNVSRSGDFSSRLRGNIYVGYAVGRHNIRATVNYTQGVRDEQGVPKSYPYSTFGIFPHDYIDLDLNYRYDVPWVDNTQLRLSIINVTDEDPMPAQLRNSYYSGVGNTRGRQLEIQITKKY